MNSKGWLLGGFLLVSGAPAQAGHWVWCEVSVGVVGDYKLYVTPVVDFEADPSFIERKGPAEALLGDRIADCYHSSTKEEGEVKRDKYTAPTRAAGVEIVTWNVDAPAKERNTKPRPTSVSGAGHLTVKIDTSLIDARKKYEQAVLQAQRDDAASRAKQIADTARDRAETKAKLDKLFEEMRKRGSAQ